MLRSTTDPPRALHALLLFLLPWAVVELAFGEEGFCSASLSTTDSNSQPLYWKVTNPTLLPTHLQDLPGFTRSVYKRDHALITPESHVFSPLPDWINTLGAYLISPAMGSHFTMYLTKMQENSKSGLPPEDVERFVFVIQGSAILSNNSGINHKLPVDSYAYLPANVEHTLKCDKTATLIIFERRYAILQDHYPEQIIGSTDKQPLLETPGEVFELRKLLPTSASYDFNIHVPSSSWRCHLDGTICTSMVCSAGKNPLKVLAVQGCQQESFVI
ncbi:probable (S)-ureidoglycine aminohydrolase isoform X3 [Phoenix dactylifera]|uniref:Probable (S)-ureidoglycine aminohydrolase isoform X3 n=1 Tax=Phoenix dactylifera TaxID=42345 RepID=A0A8B7CA90_PHODC|nr:probable (S)-ureidoglycine aminohydrolase isoform X3 [Phoenix dactylifera]